MQRPQAWLREDKLEYDAEPLAFVGSARLSDRPEAIGAEMRRILGLGHGCASRVRAWEDAVSALRSAVEGLGVIAVINGVVGNDTHRRLDVDEFRGFALSDDIAPLIFVNGADAKSAQMFTLAHELAHLWLGSTGSGLSGFPGIFPGGREVEIFCDRAAAEFLLPEAELREQWPEVSRLPNAFEALPRRYKVSPIVVGRRAMDTRLVAREDFFEFYERYRTREARREQPSATRGNF